MPPDRIFVFPGKAKLEIMSGNSFVNNDRPRTAFLEKTMFLASA